MARVTEPANLASTFQRNRSELFPAGLGEELIKLSVLAAGPVATNGRYFSLVTGNPTYWLVSFEEIAS